MSFSNIVKFATRRIEGKKCSFVMDVIVVG